MASDTTLLAGVARHVLPAEPALRRSLGRAFPGCDVDDVVQEAYCRIAANRDLDRIEEPRRYLFPTARNVVLADLRRRRVVRIEAAGRQPTWKRRSPPTNCRPTGWQVAAGCWPMSTRCSPRWPSARAPPSACASSMGCRSARSPSGWARRRRSSRMTWPAACARCSPG